MLALAEQQGRSFELSANCKDALRACPVGCLFDLLQALALSETLPAPRLDNVLPTETSIPVLPATLQLFPRLPLTDGALDDRSFTRFTQLKRRPYLALDKATADKLTNDMIPRGTR